MSGISLERKLPLLIGALLLLALIVTVESEPGHGPRFTLWLSGA